MDEDDWGSKNDDPFDEKWDEGTLSLLPKKQADPACMQACFCIQIDNW